jgi:hypothetical protein
LLQSGYASGMYLTHVPGRDLCLCPVSDDKLVIWPQSLAPSFLRAPMIFSGPDLALRAQLPAAAHAPAPSHLRPLTVPKQRLAGRREGTEERACRQELQQAVERRGRVASRLLTKLQPRHMGLANECPLQGKGVAGCSLSAARVRIQPLGWLWS